MDLLLHSPTLDRELSRYYQRAFDNAVELFVVTAYLTEWKKDLHLNSECRSFRILIGKDFGITRKDACKTVMQWLPPSRKAQFMVADRISGFHPKALFWKEKTGECFAIVGSSNLTHAAFETNYEANVFFPLSITDYVKAKRWVRDIEKQSVVVSEDWLKKYREARLQQYGPRGPKPGARVVPLKLPMPLGMNEAIEKRRDKLAAYEKLRDGLIQLFRRCASKEISSEEFYAQLEKYWSYKAGDRLQGAGFERTGADANFQELSQSFVRVLDTAPDDRDDVVVEEIDRLAGERVAPRGSFMSEMLCLRFPKEYPLLDTPVKKYLKSVAFKAPRTASEGASFIHLAKTLRSSLLDDPGYPAKNLAELDTVIWLVFGKRNTKHGTAA